jgi:hypothetical protein
MRAAVLISGQPRFTREFDDFLSNLKNYDQLDFFFYLWNVKAGENEFVTPSWPNSADSIQSKIKNNLPPNSTIIKLEIVDQPEYKPTKEYKLTPWTNPINMWLMFYGIKQVNRLREEWETKQGAYDLVIRARPDVGISSPLDLRHTKVFIDQNPNCVIIPNNHRHGIGIAVNDMIGIGSGPTLSTYAKVFDHLNQYHDSGVPYHNETLLGHHLNVNGIQYPATDINVVFREYHHPHHGRSDFGSWL